MSENIVESSKISWITRQQTQPIQNMAPSGEISKKQQEKGGHTQKAPEMGEISPNQPHKQEI